MPGGTRNQRVPANLRIVVGMGIDEPRRDDQICSIDNFLGTICDFTNGGNLSVGHGYIRAVAWRTSTVNNGSVLNEYIVRHRVLLSLLPRARLATRDADGFPEKPNRCLYVIQRKHRTPDLLVRQPRQNLRCQTRCIHINELTREAGKTCPVLQLSLAYYNLPRGGLNAQAAEMIGFKDQHRPGSQNDLDPPTV